jgi:ABC-2 type transport system ATP-binding protein
MNALLEVKSLTKRFGDLTAVNKLSFKVNAGEIWGFIGPNGAGKTTTMRVCSTLDLPDSGDVFLDGESILVHPNRAHSRIGFMPDALGVYSDTTLEEYLDFFARVANLKGQERTSRIDSVLNFTELGDLRNRMMDSLSKGMSQRLCLAKTLLHDPDLLILDEPASGLDPRARVEFRELIRALAGQGKGILISSHILSELSETCDGVVVIEQGKLIREGLVSDLSADVAEHQLLFVRTLAPEDQLEMALLEHPGTIKTRPERSGIMVEFDGDEVAISSLLTALVHKELQPVEFHWHRVDLEELFLNFTRGTLQ